jgi:hypothetical protein
MKRLQEDPKMLLQEEAMYAEPILMPTVNKTMTLWAPSSIPSNGLYALYSDRGNNYATATNTTMSNNPASDPYSSFRSRDAYGAGSMRSQQQPQHSTAYNGQQQLVRNGRRCGRPPAAWAARRLGRPLRWNAPIQQQSRKSWRQLQNGP